MEIFFKSLELSIPQILVLIQHMERKNDKPQLGSNIIIIFRKPAYARECWGFFFKTFLSDLKSIRLKKAK